MGDRVVSGRATDKDKFVPEGGQDLKFWEMSLDPKGGRVGTGRRATSSSGP